MARNNANYYYYLIAILINIIITDIKESPIIAAEELNKLNNSYLF